MPLVSFRLNLSRSEAVVFVLVGLLFTSAGGYLLYTEHQATARADRVEATIVSSYVVERNAGLADSGSHFAPRIEYRYAYEGTTYTSSTLCPGSGTGCTGGNTLESARQTVAQYPNGSTTAAYVDPADPSQAYLIAPGVTLAYFVPLGMGLVVLLLGVRSYVRQGRRAVPPR